MIDTLHLLLDATVDHPEDHPVMALAMAGGFFNGMLCFFFIIS